MLEFVLYWERFMASNNIKQNSFFHLVYHLKTVGYELLEHNDWVFVYWKSIMIAILINSPLFGLNFVGIDLRKIEPSDKRN